ncbi:hypothetical protein N7448_000138 [Penicillium atrosanguineum]|nr:hypothetical protein N7448_000138 [Penicillium atrosanguineum]
MTEIWHFKCWKRIPPSILLGHILSLPMNLLDGANYHQAKAIHLFSEPIAEQSKEQSEIENLRPSLTVYSNWRPVDLHAEYCLHLRSFLSIIERELSGISLAHSRIISAAGAFILNVIYGYNIEPHGEDPLVRLADLALSQFSEAIAPGAWLVDLIPALKYLPDFKWIGGEDQRSFVSTLLQQGEEEEIVKWSAVALYGGGSDTTVGVLEGFFLAMLLFPDVQHKAQAEMDKVFGKPTFPTAADRETLPYLNAVVKEALRWHTVSPLGIPHRTDEDDIISGFLIPKDAILLPNIWSFNNDPSSYSNPREFCPERFLSSPSALEPGDVTFGFGRRVCPGRLVAETSVFLMIAHTLAVFDIRKPIRQDGKEVEPMVHFTPGILSHPVPFEAAFIPRSQEHEQLIIDFEKAHPVGKGDSNALADALVN